MSKVSKNSDFLSLMLKHGQNPRERRHLIALANKNEIDACCEVYLNILKGNVPITPSLAAKLRKHKKNCRLLIGKRTPLAQKRKILAGQVGGFLPFFAKALFPILGGLIGTVFNKRH